jgi:hypothetical protein
MRAVTACAARSLRVTTIALKAFAKAQDKRVWLLDSWGPNGHYDLSSYADAITVCRR